MRWTLVGLVMLIALSMAAWVWLEPSSAMKSAATQEIPRASNGSVTSDRDESVADTTPANRVSQPTLDARSLLEQAREIAAAVDASGLITHAQHESGACLAKTGPEVVHRKATVHRWVDAAGIIHYSDQPPDGDVSGLRRIEVEGTPPIVVKARGYDVNLPDLVQQRALADASAIERVLRTSLGIEGDPGFTLDIEFIQNAETYIKRVGNPALATSAGAYSSRLRTIYVRLQNDLETNFVILRHEIAHALLHERVGHLPVTLNEGLAGYFERLEVAGMGAQISFAGARHALATAKVSDDGADELVELIATEGTDFYAEGREVRYLRSFALVAVLMERPEGRAALSAMLAAQRADSCNPVDPTPYLSAGYPSGLAGLARDWSRWLRSPQSSVQAF